MSLAQRELVLDDGAAALYAVSSFDDATKQIKLGLSGIGAGSNASIADIRRLGDEISKTQGISAGAGRDIALGVAKTGSIDKNSIGGVGNLTRGYANLTGTDLPTAGAALADIFADPAKGADRMNAVLGTLDAKTRDYISSLQAQNRQQDAVRALLAAVTPGITRAAQETGFWAGAWDRVTRGAAGAEEAVRRVIAPTAIEQLNRLNEQLAALQRGAGAPENQTVAIRIGRQGAEATMKKRIDELKAQVKAEEDAQKATADIVNTAKQSDIGTSVVASVSPAAQAITDLQNRITSLDTALNTPGVADKITGGADKARETLKSLQARLSEVQADYAKGGEVAAEASKAADFKLATAGVDGYAAAIRAARRDVEDLIQKAKTSGDAANFAAAKRSAEATGASNISAIQKDYLAKPSSFSKSVNDAPAQFRDAIFAASEKSATDPNYLASVLYRESRFDPKAHSPAGADGIAQFVPSTAKQYGVDTTDPTSSIFGAAKYLAELKQMFAGNLTLSTTAYNAGPGAVQRALKSGGGIASLSKEARDYAPAILNTTDPEKQLAYAKEQDQVYASQKVTLDALVASQGRNTEAVTRAEQVQRAYDQAVASGFEPGEATRKQVAARVDGLLALENAQRRVQASAAIQGEFARLGRTDDQNQVYDRASQYASPDSPEFKGYVDSLTQVQRLASAKEDLASPFRAVTDALIEGKSAADALKQSVQQLAEKALSKVEDGLLSSLSGGGGAAGGGIFSSIGSLFGFGSVVRKAGGGVVQGPGTGTSDSVPALLSRGEFVVRAQAAGANMPLLRALNDRRGVRFAAGGVVGMSAVPNAMQPSRTTASNDNRSVYNIDARGAQAGVAAQIAAAVRQHDAEINRTIGQRYGNWRANSLRG